MEENIKKGAYATLVATHDYTWGAICCAISAKIAEVKYPFYFLVNENVYDEDFYNQLKETLKPLDIRVRVVKNLNFNTKIDERYKCTLQKLEILLLEEEKVIFLDADTILYYNADRLFDLNNPYIFENRHNYDPTVLPYRFCGECFLITTSASDYEFLLQAIKDEETVGDMFKKLKDDEDLYAFLYGYKVTNSFEAADSIFKYVGHYAQMPKYWLKEDIN